MRLVLVAVIISIPISYYLLNEWLNSFAYAIDLQWWVFIMAGMISVVIALVTTGSQAVKASLINPSKCLRNE